MMSAAPPPRSSRSRGSSSSRMLSSSSAALSSSSSAFASSSSTFRSGGFYVRSTSPTRVNVPSSSPSTSFRLSLTDRPTSPGRSLTVTARDRPSVPSPGRRMTCMCSPTTHPGSFRCKLHKNSGNGHVSRGTPSPSASTRLNMRRSAMTNSLVRIGTVEGSDLIKRALSSLIRPSSHQQRRRFDFQPRPSRLSNMSTAGS